MAVDSPVVESTGRDLSDEALLSIVHLLNDVAVQSVVQKWQHNSTDDASSMVNVILGFIHSAISIVFYNMPTPNSLVTIDQFKSNMTKKSALEFINLLREAAIRNNVELWHPLTTHEKAEFTINLRKKPLWNLGSHLGWASHAYWMSSPKHTSSFPSTYAEKRPMKTVKVITELTNITSWSERITKFREFMVDGQTVASIGAKRQSFYNEIGNTVLATMKTSDPSPNCGDGSRHWKRSKLALAHSPMAQRIFGKYKTIEDVTSTECVVHMGRPLQVGYPLRLQ
ncbi:hypothetical protein EDB92DRAFT_1816007 [Lactarius akahatsu]|uniref:Uncharacterized protein n=1 Tax=Lactarius akahatsu TaxID=416441 RepID=A0AAD4LIL3_9AGAM|nr:hypothetical protein EDB92DRAFT_1816007 [Lactarius akahatsu]